MADNEDKGGLVQLAAALRDPEFWKGTGRGLLDTANRGVVSGLLGAPVDITTMLMRPFGYTVPNPVGGSEWIGNKMQQAGMVSPNRNALAEALAGLIDPATMQAGAMKSIGLLGMMKTPVGRIPETAADTNKLADIIRRAGEAKGYEVTQEGSAVSPSRYVTFSSPDGALTRQVRISNHADKYPELANGVRTSVDPSTGVSFEQAVNWLGREGFPTQLSSRYSGVPTWEQYYAQQRAAQQAPEAILQKRIDAWRNQPKATRGPMPTLADID